MHSDPSQNISQGSGRARFSGSSVKWDATKTEAPVELLQAGFQLAYFLVSDRSAAIDILGRALEKIRVRSRRETRRLYWRDKHADRPFRRIARSDIDTLQWLIMSESTEHEKVQESIQTPSAESMVTRYIKHLANVASGFSSFYVNVAMNRVLRNYTTPQAQRLYEMLSSRFPGPDEYRRAKAVLMDKIRQRFGPFLKITRVDHGELRFEALEGQQQWSSLVDHCLNFFTPWSTRGHCSEFLAAPGPEPIADPSADKNEMEIKLCHVLIDPECSKRVLTQLALDSPDTKLALPRFDMPQRQEKNDGGAPPGSAPDLSLTDLDEIQRRLAGADARRRSIAPRVVTVIVDGVEQAHMNLTGISQVELEIEESATLIEVRGEDNHGSVLVATHFVSRTDSGFNRAEDFATISGGRLKFRIRPTLTSVGIMPRATLCLSYRPRLSFPRPGVFWRVLTKSRRPVLSYALAGITIAIIASAVTGAFYRNQIKELERQLREAHRNTSPRAITSYTLIRDDQRVRNIEASAIPEIPLQAQAPAVNLDLPLLRNAKTQAVSVELKTFTGEVTLLTLNSIQARRTDTGLRIDVIVPTALFHAETYYMVRVQSSDATDNFTFKVVPKMSDNVLQ